MIENAFQRRCVSRVDTEVVVIDQETVVYRFEFDRSGSEEESNN